MTIYKLASTDEFLGLCQEAIMNDRNRQIDIAELCRFIDPNGTHVGEIIMLHEHVNGVLVEPHYRTRWQIKKKGSYDPVEGWLDLSFQAYDKLRTHDTKVKA